MANHRSPHIIPGKPGQYSANYRSILKRYREQLSEMKPGTIIFQKLWLTAERIRQRLGDQTLLPHTDETKLQLLSSPSEAEASVEAENALTKLEKALTPKQAATLETIRIKNEDAQREDEMDEWVRKRKEDKPEDQR